MYSQTVQRVPFLVSTIALKQTGDWPTPGIWQYNLNLGLQIIFMHRINTYKTKKLQKHSTSRAHCLRSLSASRKFDGVLVVNGVLAPVEPLLHPLVVLPPHHLHLLPLFPPLRQALPFQHPDDLGHGRAVLGVHSSAICIIISTSCPL
jgi:hypothetical protein